MLTVNPRVVMISSMASESLDHVAALTLAVGGFLASRRSTHTRAGYGADLAQFAAWCASGEPLDLLTVDADDIARYRLVCESQGLSPATIARRLSAITSFCAYAAEQGLDPDFAGEAALMRPNVPRQSTAQRLSDDEAAALLDAADRTGERSAVLIRLLMLDGLKVGEAVRGDASDVHGKPPRTTLDVARRTSPTIVLHPDTGRAVRRYLGRRRRGPLLLSERRGQAPGRLTRFGVDYLVKEVAREAGLNATISGNTLRRRYVMAAHASGTGLDRIAHNTGHANPRTTRRYLDGDSETKARSAGRPA